MLAVMLIGAVRAKGRAGKPERRLLQYPAKGPSGSAQGKRDSAGGRAQITFWIYFEAATNQADGLRSSVVAH
jgi:hypothetical protein